MRSVCHSLSVGCQSQHGARAATSGLVNYPQQDPRHNRSTEASNLLLHDHYCLLGDDVSPTFADYLSVPNQHAGRYILKDPTSGRDIGFSVQSGGNAPYRFYWVDEDFSATPFGHTPDAQVFRTRVDVWRRCK